MTGDAAAKIRKLLDTCDDVDTRHIVVAEQDGYVLLEGHVSSYPAIFKVTDFIQKSAENSVLLNHLTVRLPGEKGRDDTDIAKDVALVVSTDPTIKQSQLRYSVRKGVVTISGRTSDAAHVKRAEQLLADIPGLDGVLNQARIES